MTFSRSEQAVRKLLNHSSRPIGQELREASPVDIADEQLRALLREKNGFFAFGSALHVFPLDSGVSGPDLIGWNDLSGWRRHYSDAVPESAMVFAQDLFANQYFVGLDGVFKLNSETGETEIRGETIEAWVEAVLEDYNYETGYPIGLEWQKLNHPLQPDCRLLPKKPFVLGGEYVPENLVEVEASVAMEKLGQLSAELNGLPDGTAVELAGWL